MFKSRAIYNTYNSLRQDLRKIMWRIYEKNFLKFIVLIQNIKSYKISDNKKAGLTQPAFGVAATQN